VKFSRVIYGAAVPLTLAGVVATTVPMAASAAVRPQPVKTVHLVEKSGLRFGFETKAAQVSSFRILVKVGAYNRAVGSEDFKVLASPDGTYKLEYAPLGHSTARYLAVYEREQGHHARSAFFTPDARLVPIQFATSFRTGPAGPLGYSQLSAIHRHGRHIQVLYLTAERTGKLDLQTSKLIPFSGIPASQLWRLDTQIQAPAR
jgi:hypothetical protein